MRHIAALALALAVAAPAQADVVYNWIPETGVAYEGAKMVFDDSGVEYYSISHERGCEDLIDYEDGNGCDPFVDPDSPLLLFQFGMLNIKPRLGTHFMFDQARMSISPTYMWMNDEFVYLRSEMDELDPTLMHITNLTWDGMPPIYDISGRWVREQAAAVPLPGTLALIGLGLLGVRTVRRRGSPGGRGSKLICD